MRRISLAELHDSERLERAREQTGLSRNQLWLRYFELGGDATPLELEAALTGLVRLNRLQHDIVAHALNERFMELGRNHPVPYAF